MLLHTHERASQENERGETMAELEDYLNVHCMQIRFSRLSQPPSDRLTEMRGKQRQTHQIVHTHAHTGSIPCTHPSEITVLLKI